MAEARQATHVLQQKRGFRLGLAKDDESYDITISVPHPRYVRKSCVRCMGRARNRVTDMLFPARPLILISVMAVVVAVVVTADRQSWWRQGFLAEALWYIDSRVGFVSLPIVVRVGVLAAEAAIVGFFLLMYLQRVLLRALFSYKGWLYQPPRSVSWPVMIWGAVVRLLSGRSPLTYSFQGALPRQPVPSISATCAKYLESVAPLLSPEELANTQRALAVFKAKEAPKLQWYLVMKSWFVSNYVTDWWEKFVYHRGRDSIMINSNYYILDSADGVPTPHQLVRAASMVMQFVHFKRLIDHERLDPMLIRGTVPLCMAQYRRMFGTTRLPGREVDSLQQTAWAKHIAVLRRGHWFRVDAFDSHDQPLHASQMEMLLQQVVDLADAAPRPSMEQARIAALTADNRQRWADVREVEFSEGVNLASLEVIERALFVLVLDDEPPPATWSQRGRALLHGNGSNRWFDKSLTLVVFSDGHAGMNAEHSWADAPVVAHMWESCVADQLIAGLVYDRQGRCAATGPKATGRIRPPVLLEWQLSPRCRLAIGEAVARANEAVDDFDLVVFAFEDFGKGFIKQCQVSPDAFIQLALQLAYYNDTKGQFALTYESSMTRLYRHGRTETVRSLSKESCAFVREITKAKYKNGVRAAEDRETLVDMVRAATAVHQQKYRDAMSGKGIDRHLFALYVVAKGRDMSSDFLNQALSMPWKLSTSQQPQVQTKKWPGVKQSLATGNVPWWSKGKLQTTGPKDLYQVFSPGGGFGPVADNGYGVSYMVTGEDRIYFHVSSKKHSEHTNSERFRGHVLAAFATIHALFKAHAADTSSAGGQ